MLTVRTILAAVVTVVMVGKSHYAIADNGYDVWDMNDGKSEIAPGTIYVLEEGSLKPLVDLFKLVPLNEIGSWVATTQPHCAKSALVSIPRQYNSGCRCYVACAQMAIAGGIHRRDTLGDPFDSLEILNRMSTGLVYNLDAESKIAQWRETIMEAIRRPRSPTGAKVVMCVEVVAAVEPCVIVEGAVSAEDADALLKYVFSPHGLSCKKADGVYPAFKGRLDRKRFVLHARFRELKAVTETTFPQIQFAYGDDQTIGVFPKEVLATTNVK